MCLLDEVLCWTAGAIRCRTRSHLAPGNPLRRDGRLAAVCGAEYGLQAAALHGALIAGGVAQPAGYVAALRDLELGAARLDDPAHGALEVSAFSERAEAGGLIYRFTVATAAGRALVSGRAIIALPRVPVSGGVCGRAAASPEAQAGTAATPPGLSR